MNKWSIQLEVELNNQTYFISSLDTMEFDDIALFAERSVYNIQCNPKSHRVIIIHLYFHHSINAVKSIFKWKTFGKYT